MNAKVEIKHVHDKYIYLDWNVFKYMKNPRMDKNEVDKEFYQAVCMLKKRYRFPTSLAHIKDRLRNYSVEHRKDIEDDFEFAYSVSEGKYVSFIAQEKGLGIVTADIRAAIDEYLNECNEEKTARKKNGVFRRHPDPGACDAVQWAPDSGVHCFV